MRAPWVPLVFGPGVCVKVCVVLRLGRIVPQEACIRICGTPWISVETANCAHLHPQRDVVLVAPHGGPSGEREHAGRMCEGFGA